MLLGKRKRVELLKVVYEVGSDVEDVGWSYELVRTLLSFVFPGFWPCPLLLGFRVFCFPRI